MDGIGILIIVLLVFMGAAGLVMVLTSITREPAPREEVPTASVVEGRTSPIRPARRRVKLSPGLLIGGMFLLAIGGGALLFVYGLAGLGRIASH